MESEKKVKLIGKWKKWEKIKSGKNKEKEKEREREKVIFHVNSNVLKKKWKRTS